jgi:hypothetical protein
MNLVELCVVHKYGYRLRTTAPSWWRTTREQDLRYSNVASATKVASLQELLGNGIHFTITFLARAIWRGMQCTYYF